MVMLFAAASDVALPPSTRPTAPDKVSAVLLAPTSVGLPLAVGASAVSVLTAGTLTVAVRTPVTPLVAVVPVPNTPIGSAVIIALARRPAIV